MIVLVCTELHGGLRFGGRRLSRDRVLTTRMRILAGEAPLWVAPGSQSLFPPGAVRVDADFLSRAGAGEFCFVESPLPAACLPRIERIFRFNWNRSYPADEFFALPAGFHLIDVTEFPGFSHPVITQEVYAR